MPYELSSDPHVKAAQLLGMQMARDDQQEQAQEDAAQDAVLALLEAEHAGTTVVTKGEIVTRLVGQPPDSKTYKKQRRPLLRRSYGECLEELPEWAL